MAKRKKKARRRAKKKIPLAVVGGLLAGVADPIQDVINGDVKMAMRRLAFRYTGYDFEAKKWSADGLKMGLLPLAVGIGISKAASWLGLNRYFGKLPIKI